jgi:hypothetical protein
MDLDGSGVALPSSFNQPILFDYTGRMQIDFLAHLDTKAKAPEILRADARSPDELVTSYEK